MSVFVLAKKWPEKVIQMSFIKEHLFVNRLYTVGSRYHQVETGNLDLL